MFTIYALKPAFLCSTAYFGYIEASGRQPESYADLQIPDILTGSPAYCLSFAHHMLGDHVGRLEVLADGVVIWSQVGGKHEGDVIIMWFYAWNAQIHPACYISVNIHMA